jgi:hypothetical protein
MKIAQHFREFLETNLYLQLPGLGRFDVISLNPDPENGYSSRRLLQFSPDYSIKPDQQLTDFLSKKVNCDPCVAESDLAYFCSATKELLMQSFEAEIPGVGFIRPDAANKLQFSNTRRYNDAKPKKRKKSPAYMSLSFWF